MEGTQKLKRKDLVYPELSYKIIGILFEVLKELGSGYREKYYQKAIASELSRQGITHKEQVYVSLEYKGTKIGKLFFDFLIEEKIVLEIKRDNKFSKKNIDQIYSYLKSKELKLGILANFTKDGVKYKRILNVT